MMIYHLVCLDSITYRFRNRDYFIAFTFWWYLHIEIGKEFCIKLPSTYTSYINLCKQVF